MAFDYWRVRWLWIHTSTLWLDLQSYYNFSLASQEQASCQGTEKYERHRQNSHPGSHGYAFYVCLRFDLNEKQRIRVTQLTQNSVRSLRPADILQNCSMLTQRRLIVDKVIIWFSLCTKVFSSLCKITVEPLMSDGLFGRCLYILFCALTILFTQQSVDSHKPPGFHPK